MRRATTIGTGLVLGIAVLVFSVIALSPEGENGSHPAPRNSATTARTSDAGAATPADGGAGLLFGRITTGSATYEGRLRWGGNQEASWGDYFDGTKSANPWAYHAPVKQSEKERLKVEVFGFAFGGPDRSHLKRRFLARFGDIARIVRGFKDVQVTLKSGTIVTLDRFEAGDIDDGVRVWDRNRGEVDVDDGEIRTIEFLPAPAPAGAPERLHGVVRTARGNYTGFIGWDQYDGVSTDTLDGRMDDGEQHVPYDSIRSVARASRDSALVTLHDGREMVLSKTRESGRGHRGVYVDDTRYGRVLISWDAFERVDFTAGGTPPGYADFQPGRPLGGTVTTRDGRRLEGRLVYDFDETETTETLDVSFKGVDYGIPLGMIASIVPPAREGGTGETGRVVLHGGEALQVERTGDVGATNAGMLVFVERRERPEHVPWAEVAQIDFDRPDDAAATAGGR
jgi:hypothetical protein